jgi:uncharacterized protein YggE
MSAPFIRSTLQIGLAVAVLALPVFALAPAAYAHDSETRKEPVIVVSGRGEATVAPDLAIVSLSVAETRKTAREALEANNAAMAKVLKALKDQGIAERDLQTSQFSIQPQYSYPQNDDGTPRPPVLEGYLVTNGLTVRVRDLGRLGAILDQAVTLGVNQGGDISFSNDNPTETLQTARTRAVKDAMAKADTLAKAAGVRLGRIVEITENVTDSDPRPLARMQMAKEAVDAVPVAAGENSYAVNVSLRFEIAP